MKDLRKNNWGVEGAPRIGLVALLVVIAPFFAGIENCAAADEQTNEMNRLANAAKAEERQLPEIVRNARRDITIGTLTGAADNPDALLALDDQLSKAVKALS